ncbi:MAG: hypothetical protein POELPBGB_03133 [Bacteroidia bacterium]|nr:hypothetical protein [Bacteroidia bacterium]
MNIAAQKMEQIREVFQAAKVFCAGENDLQKIVAYCDNTGSEFRSIAYEATSMQVALRDFAANNSLKAWKTFADDYAKSNATQVYVGLGWAVAQQSVQLDKVIEDLPQLLKYRVADGCGYYDATFRNRQTVRSKQLPIYISGKALQPYFQGAGRALWYLSKGDVVKTNELLLSFDKQYHADMWRGVGTAVAYVGGCDEATLNELKTVAGNFLPQLKSGVALALRSRMQSNCITGDAELCAKVLLNSSSLAATQLTVAAESDDYFQWLNSIENIL